MLRPTVFGKYCLLERVSVGGMAEVYRARPLNAPGFQRYLAVKRILPNLAEDDEFISMFVDEARIAVQLHHRHVCQIYELGRNGPSYYMVMEYIAGKDLLQLQNRFRTSRRIMSVTQALYIAASICDGLDYAHRKASDDGTPLHIVHRDISPQNVLISFDGEVKVIDFGIARAATKNQQTQVGVLKGKFGYMSPEQVSGDAIDHRSDIFAVGTLLWEMLTARRLFHGESDFVTLEKVRSADIPPPSARNRRVPAEVDAIVMRALQRDRDQRYGWASEMADDLRAVLTTVNPPYTQDTLSAWMVRNWPEDLANERARHAEFARFVTQADVQAYYDEVFGGVDLDGVEELDVDALEDFTRVARDDERASQDGEVLAENEEEPMATVVLDTRGVDLPDLDALLGGRSPDPDALGDALGEVDESEGTALVARPEPLIELRRRRTPMTWIVTLLALAVAGVGAWVMWAHRPAPAEAPVEAWDVTLDVVPGDGLTVVLGDVTVEGDAPLVVRSVPGGRQMVEIRRDGYVPLVREIDVSAGQRVFALQLEAEEGEGRLVLQLEPDSARVYVDGSLVGGQGARREISTAGGEAHTVEVMADGYFVEELELTPDVGATLRRDVQLRPVRGTLSVGSEPAGELFVNGVSHGSTEGGVTVTDLDPASVLDLEVRPATAGFRPWSQAVVFDTFYDLRMHPRLPRLGSSESGTMVVPYGFLAVGDADRWYRVFVDGRDTGLLTPIDETRPLPLRAGDRTVSFVRADERVDVEVTIVAGEVLNVPFPSP